MQSILSTMSGVREKGKMPHFWHRAISFSTVAVFMSFLMVQAYLGGYSRWIADDYCSASIAVSKGILGGTLHWYMTWSGRFSASFLDSLMGIIDPRFTSFAPAVSIVIWLFMLSVVFYNLRIISHSRLRFLGAVFMASVLLSATLIITPNLMQSLYWGQGRRSAVLPLILGTALVALLQYIYTHRSKTPPVMVVVAGGLTFFAGGFSETYVVLQSFLLFVVMIWIGVLFMLDRQKHTMDVAVYTASMRIILPIIAVGLFCSVLSLIVIAVAPGNKFRQTFYPPPPGLLEIMQIATWSTIRFVGKIILSPEKLLSVLGVIGFSALFGSGQILGKNPRVFSRRAIEKLLFWLPLLTLLLLIVCFVPAAYGMSSAMPSRTRIIPTYLLVWSLAFWGYFLGQYHQMEGSPLGRGKQSVLWFQLAAWGICILFTIQTVWLAYNALQFQPQLKSYAQNWDRVDQDIREAKREGKNSVVVMPVHNLAGLSDFGEDSQYWVNQCVSSYYGLEVTTSDSTE